ncbi:regulator of G-protein signaling 5 isoform X1 [Grus americana]|uniref:regulator of G-protein signaling 5 isoform X1 n=1 Tax=Grus americana TaxID=9117 RepID=UPI00240828A0|nr:regulator of G-protein signaling 5 isoform X1 [Grus americana]
MCKGLAALPHTCLERAKEIKTKLGTLLQKPDSAIDFIIPYPEKPEKPPKAQKPSPEEALQWRDSLEKLLQNPYGLASFRSFLRSEFSEENVEFWVACEDYKKTKSPVKMAEKAKKIYEEFIQTEAPKEVSGCGAGDGAGRDEAAAQVASIPKESNGCRAPRTTAEGLRGLHPQRGAAPSPRAALPPFAAPAPLFTHPASAGLPPTTGTSGTCPPPSHRGLRLIIRDGSLW